MTVSDVLQRAKQGEAKAIAALLNRQLRPRGLSARAKRQGEVLALLIEAESVPNSTKLIPYLQQAFQKLDSPEITMVQVHGRAKNAVKAAWVKQFSVAIAPTTPPEPSPQPPEPSESPETPETPESPDTPRPPSLAKIPTRPFLQQWLWLNCLASVLMMAIDLSSRMIWPQLDSLNALILTVLGTLIPSGAQTYVLARRLPHAPEWLLAAILALLIPFQDLKTVRLLTGVFLLGLQYLVLRRVSDRAYWWPITNALTVVGLTFFGVVFSAVSRLGLFLGLMGLNDFWQALGNALFTVILVMVQGMVLKAVLQPLDDRPVLPPFAYFQAQLCNVLQIGQGSRGARRSASPKVVAGRQRQ